MDHIEKESEYTVDIAKNGEPTYPVGLKITLLSTWKEDNLSQYVQTMGTAWGSHIAVKKKKWLPCFQVHQQIISTL